MPKTGLLVIDELDLEQSSDEELSNVFLMVAKEMTQRGRPVWEDFLQKLAKDSDKNEICILFGDAKELRSCHDDI